MGVEGDGPLDAAGAQLGERPAFVGVVLADVDGELPHPLGMAGQQGAQPAAGPHGAQLAVVADDDHLGLGPRRDGEEAGEVGVVGHAGLVEDEDVAGGEADPVMGEPPAQRGDRPGLLEPGALAEAAGGLAGRGCADHGEPGRGEPIRDGAEHGRLAGPGDPDHQLQPRPGAEQPPGGSALPWRQLRPEAPPRPPRRRPRPPQR